MGNFRNITKRLFNFALAFGLTTGLASPLSAKNAATVPEEIREVIQEIQRSANQQDVARVMSYYSSEFTNSDGLTYSTLSAALKQVWQRYPRLTYTTEIISWQQQGNRLVVETVTRMQGINREGSRMMRLSANVQSRQHFVARKIVEQEILVERTQIDSGNNPPRIQINLPKQVRVGQRFSFDAIVTEPLRGEVLFGAAIAEKTNSSLYLEPSTVELRPLPAGGIFKLAAAPIVPEALWYSAIIARSDGITIVTQRVVVAD